MYTLSADLRTGNVVKFQIQDIRTLRKCMSGLRFLKILGEYLWGPDD
jgi:hypothetical protein